MGPMSKSRKLLSASTPASGAAWVPSVVWERGGRRVVVPVSELAWRREPSRAGSVGEEVN